MFKLVTPATPIITTAEAKAFLIVEHSADDALIDRLIASATRTVEKQTGRQLGQATWELYLNRFPTRIIDRNGAGGAIEIRKAPVISISEVAYTDPNGDQQTTTFLDNVISEPAYVFPPYGESWPSTRAVPNAVKVTFVAGYATVPEDVKTAVLLILRSLYENRGEAPDKALDLAINAHIDSIRWTL